MLSVTKEKSVLSEIPVASAYDVPFFKSQPVKLLASTGLAFMLYLSPFLYVPGPEYCLRSPAGSSIEMVDVFSEA